MTWTVRTHYTEDFTQTWCDECDYRVNGIDVRLQAIQHTKVTGHTTRANRELHETITPDKEEDE